MTPTPSNKASTSNGGPRDLPDALHHVFYEMEMLFGTRDVLFAPRDTSSDMGKRLILQSAVLESFIVHVRCLEEFFSQRTDPTGRNMKAVDFVSTWKPVEPLAEKVIDRMNREISHIGWSRKPFRAETQGWSVHQMIHLLAETSLRFLAEVRKDAQLMAFEKNQRACDSLTARFQAYRTAPEANSDLCSSAPPYVSKSLVGKIASKGITGHQTSTTSEDSVTTGSA